MLPEATKPVPTLAQVDGENNNRKQLDREIRDMINALTRRLADLQHAQKRGGSAGQHDDQGDEDDDDDRGVRIITLAGSNVGATMRSELELDDKDKPLAADDDDASVGQPQPWSAYVNSNFQAINNSIMLGGAYSTNDPGVHMEVSDYMEHKAQDHGHDHDHDHDHDHGHGHHKHAGKMGKKKDEDTKEKETSKSDRELYAEPELSD